MTDAEGVQPDEGQGAQAQDTPYAQYLERFPEEARDIASEVFKEWDGNVTKRFQEHSQFRAQMEPFAPLLNGRTADEVEWGLQFRDAATSNPQAIKEWFDSFAEEHGLTKQEQAALEADLLDDPDLTRSLESKLAPLQQQVEAITAQFEAQQQERALAEASAQLESQLKTEEERLGKAFNRDAIEGLVGKYLDDPGNAVSRAAQEWEHIYNQIQKDTLQGKVDAARPAAESGGVPDGSPEPIKSLADASRIALEQLRGAKAM